MKILITGANGQLGYHLKQTFADHQLYLGDTSNYDITQRDLVLRETEEFKPDVIIHGAAYTNVDGAETNRELCRQINVDGSRNVAEAAAAVGATIVAISTDYVFAGDKGSPYLETDQPQPVSFYGQTKLEGEQAVQAATDQFFICRTSWLYGGPKPTSDLDLAATGIKNFVYTMLRVGKEKDEVAVVGDQLGAPTYAHDLAEFLKALIVTDRYGIYHATNSSVTNWAEFAAKIFELARYKTAVKPITSAEWEAINPASTKRPAYSVLGHEAIKQAGLPDLRPWDAALADFMSDWDRSS